MRWLLRLAPVTLIAALAAPAPGLVIAMRPGPQRAVTADVVVVGKVTAIEKEMVQALPFPKAPAKADFKVAVVKIDAGLAGVQNLTHIKVGFIPRPVVAPPQPQVQPRPGLIRPAIARRPGFQLPELKVGDEFLLFLVKHPDGGFYVMPNQSPPIDVKTAAGKKEAEGIKQILALLADPMKGLKSAKAEDRYRTATALITRYRSYPDRGGEVEQVAIPVEESQLILKGLAEGDWAKFEPNTMRATQSFYSLGLTDKDGWVQPKPVRPQAGKPPVNFNTLVHDAFVKWLDGPGKTYQIKKVVPKNR